MNRIGRWSEDSQSIIPLAEQPEGITVTFTLNYNIEYVLEWIDDIDDPTVIESLGPKILDIDDVKSIVMDWAMEDVLNLVEPQVEFY